MNPKPKKKTAKAKSKSGILPAARVYDVIAPYTAGNITVHVRVATPQAPILSFSASVNPVCLQKELLHDFL